MGNDSKKGDSILPYRVGHKGGGGGYDKLTKHSIFLGWDSMPKAFFTVGAGFQRGGRGGGHIRSKS